MFSLPTDLIAQFPLEKRDHSRLLVCDLKKKNLRHSHFWEITEHFQAGDLLVFNNTQVIPARLWVELLKNKKKVELLLLREVEGGVWECLAKPARALRMGEPLQTPDGSFKGVVCALGERGLRQIRWEPANGVSLVGEVPLPPYIKRKPEDSDRIRYQTVYAKEPGSAAAPTAGLHFTKELLSKCERQGIQMTSITLHVGLGTFRPLSDKQWEERKLHPEVYAMPEEAAKKINLALKEKRRVIAVGTTTVRALESAAKISFPLKPTQAETELFIVPPFPFQVVKGMVTNFHLPNSSLLWLVKAFAGEDFVSAAYQEAIQERYRFYSYGDAMLIL